MASAGTGSREEDLNSVLEAKAALRRDVQATLKRMTPQERAAASALARARLQAQTRWQEAGSVLFFAPLPAELDLWPLATAAVADGKCVALPKYDANSATYVPCQVQSLERDLASGRYGIREPATHCTRLPLNRLDLILVPGVAFDLHGRRLGRGKGHYDQMLAAVHGVTCGVAFEQQLVGAIPVAPHDISVNCILTPLRWLEV
jgi:5-formyltetrahydrofolate cyclo-ligase